MTRRRIVTGVQVYAARVIVKRAAMGIDTVDAHILAVANATQIGDTDTFEAVWEEETV
ncbi:MAG TPA: hypothetical protein PLZ93_17605 [Nocardioides sp.]|uniref:hypothetical protein n=1 Tax=uncultured Nocardioides sp. TaxID=198441 RepID=UPI0026386306|nr:hypothetical protein [uncultured Nocardioides sp.]HRD62789.1 hypothetical protein [Nocardioides sp.]HRI97439.1 hypothetical protein [Nocardioides sp.]HRK46981.1 hypothetical protein [Nocardioides sp.]